MVRTPSNGCKTGRIEPTVIPDAGDEPVSLFLLLHAPSVSKAMKTNRSGETTFRIMVTVLWLTGYPSKVKISNNASGMQKFLITV
jgi:hypothetical protein